ncbi:MAG: hypothetical protein SF187_09355 [Deltaproteobacteria bacterium]|nr:hypothetical protein [Deltaproteobacteria bacterium]
MTRKSPCIVVLLWALAACGGNSSESSVDATVVMNDAGVDAQLDAEPDPCSGFECAGGVCEAFRGTPICNCNAGLVLIGGRCVTCQSASAPLSLALDGKRVIVEVTEANGAPLASPLAASLFLKNDAHRILLAQAPTATLVPFGTYQLIANVFANMGPLSRVPIGDLPIGTVSVDKDSTTIRVPFPALVTVRGTVPFALDKVTFQHESGARFFVGRNAVPPNLSRMEKELGEFEFDYLPGRFDVIELLGPNVSSTFSLAGGIDSRSYQKQLLELPINPPPLATFEVKGSGSETTVPRLNIPVRAVTFKVNVKGAAPTNIANIYLVSPRATFMAQPTSNPGEFRAALPDSVYETLVTLVSREAGPLLNLRLPGGLHKIDRDRSLDLDFELVDLAARVTLNGNVPTTTTTNLRVSADSEAHPGFAAAVALTALRPDGSFRLKVPKGMPFNVSVELRDPETNSALQYGLGSAERFLGTSNPVVDLRSRRLNIKFIAPTRSNAAMRLLGSAPVMNGTAEIPLGMPLRPLLSETENSERLFVVMAPIEVPSDASEVTVTYDPKSVVGRAAVGGERMERLTFERVDAVRDPTGPESQIGVLTSLPDGSFEAWLPKGQFRISSQVGYLGCVDVK